MWNFMLGVGTGLAIAYPQEAGQLIQQGILMAHEWMLQGFQLISH